MDTEKLKDLICRKINEGDLNGPFGSMAVKLTVVAETGGDAEPSKEEIEEAIEELKDELILLSPGHLTDYWVRPYYAESISDLMEMARRQSSGPLSDTMEDAVRLMLRQATGTPGPTRWGPEFGRYNTREALEDRGVLKHFDYTGDPRTSGYYFTGRLAEYVRHARAKFHGSREAPTFPTHKERE